MDDNIDSADSRGLVNTGRILLNSTNPSWPWYWPMPLDPTPPKGRSCWATWKTQLLIVTPPEIVP